MTGIILGKLTDVYLGKRDQMIGLFFTLKGSSYGCSSSIECWDTEEIVINEGTKWTEKDRNESLIKIMREISRLLKQAKVSNINQLNNIPVGFTIKNNILDSWRILEEVL